MKVLMKKESLPIVKPFDEVIIEVLQAPKEVEREVALKDGTIKKIQDYSIIVKPVSGKFESVTEKVTSKTEDGDEVVKPKKYDASELKDKVVMKLTQKAFEVLYDAWQNKEIGEGTKLKIKVTKKQNKTYFDEITVLDEKEEEETEEEAKVKPKPKLKG
ncbi:ORF C158 [Sulfolobus virus Kamchatka 1]|uniref:ORF C158 n=1 Tax=Sulfolobus virus Kamchatka 1 TaxID=248496 RepID=Q6TDM7_9VIRU|nr:ORF C158 [Sulfolobus virus Kamchatka 1]AAQ94372.1 ORF C158 [Sulfolobus virus Kamchatka 1]